MLTNRFNTGGRVVGRGNTALSWYKTSKITLFNDSLICSIQIPENMFDIWKLNFQQHQKKKRLRLISRLTMLCARVFRREIQQFWFLQLYVPVFCVYVLLSCSLSHVLCMADHYNSVYVHAKILSLEKRWFASHELYWTCIVQHKWSHNIRSFERRVCLAICVFITMWATAESMVEFECTPQIYKNT